MKSEKIHSISYESLVDKVYRLLDKIGTPQEIAQVVAKIIVNADLTGHSTHGVSAFLLCLEEIENGLIDPKAEPVIIQKNNIGIWMDGHKGFGHYAAYLAAKEACIEAKLKGIANVWIKKTNNIGRLGEYVEMMASNGCIGIAMCGTGNVSKDATVCLPNTIKRLLGTNPIAFAFPLNDSEKFVIDLSTSSIPFHKIHKARLCKENLTPGVLVDKLGEQTINPEDYYTGGAITLAGGYKGLALSLMVSILSGLSFERLNGKEVGGVFLQAIQLDQIDQSSDYQHTVKNFLHSLRSSSTESDHIRLPGDSSSALRKKYMKEGIPIKIELLRKVDNYLHKTQKSLLVK